MEFFSHKFLCRSRWSEKRVEDELPPRIKHARFKTFSRPTIYGSRFEPEEPAMEQAARALEEEVKSQMTV